MILQILTATIFLSGLRPNYNEWKSFVLISRKLYKFISRGFIIADWWQPCNCPDCQMERTEGKAQESPSVAELKKDYERVLEEKMNTVNKVFHVALFHSSIILLALYLFIVTHFNL